MLYKFTKSGEKVLSIASDLAQELGHSYIGTEHILYGLACEGNGVASKTLEKQNITSDDILERIDELIGSHSKEKCILEGFTPRAKKILEKSYMEAKRLGSNYIGTEHILVGILGEDDSIAIRILSDFNVNIEDMYIDIAKTLNEFEENVKAQDKDSSEKR